MVQLVKFVKSRRHYLLLRYNERMAIRAYRHVLRLNPLSYQAYDALGAGEAGRLEVGRLAQTFQVCGCAACPVRSQGASQPAELSS